MSDETTRARLLTMTKDYFDQHIPNDDPRFDRILAYRVEILEWQKLAAHAETVARLEQRAAMAEMMLAQKQQLTRGIDRALRAAGFNYGENVTIRDGETIAAALIDRLAAERDALTAENATLRAQLPVTSTTAIDGYHAELRFYARGPNDPPGNGYVLVCDGCGVPMGQPHGETCPTSPLPAAHDGDVTP